MNIDLPQLLLEKDMATYSKKLKYSLKERVIEGDRRSENILGRDKKKGQ